MLDDAGTHIAVEVCGRQSIEKDGVVHDGDDRCEDRDENLSVHVDDVGVCGDGKDSSGYDIGAHIFCIESPSAYDRIDALFEFLVARVFGYMDVDIIEEAPDRMLGEL